MTATTKASGREDRRYGQGCVCADPITVERDLATVPGHGSGVRIAYL